jgi:hypothetical protein
VPIETASTDMDERNNPIPLYVTGSPPELGISIDSQTKGQIVAFAVSVGGPNMNVFTGIVVAAGYVTGIVGALCTKNATIVSFDGG